MPFEKVDRAVLAGKPEGFIKVIRRKGVLRDGLLSVTVVGERAGELIHEWVLACGGKLHSSIIVNVNMTAYMLW